MIVKPPVWAIWSAFTAVGKVESIVLMHNPCRKAKFFDSISDFDTLIEFKDSHKCEKEFNDECTQAP